MVFAGLPPFKKGEGFVDVDVDLGPLDTFTEGEWLITQFNMRPEIGEVAGRTAYVRYNGELEGEPSFTILSNRCVHLGCPVQANGPTSPDEQRTYLAGLKKVTYTPVLPAGGFGCPCHGGQYDRGQPHRRPSGARARPLGLQDRERPATPDRRLQRQRGRRLGADANIGAYRLAQPGVHVDGISQVLYPFIPPS